MMLRGQESKERSNSVSLCKRAITFVLLFASSMFVVVGHASSGTDIRVSDTGTLSIRMVFPTEHVAIRGTGGDVGGVNVELNRGEYSESLAGVRNIVITAWGTEKFIDVQGITISGDLTIRTGFEGDVISIGRTSVRSNLKVVTGGGDDYIGIDRVFVGDRATLLTGAGDDYVPMRNAFVSGVFRLLTGVGADVVSISDTDFESNTNIKTGEGDDVLISSSVNTFGVARLFTGAGNDLMNLNRSQFGQNLTIYTGADDDVLEMRQNTVSGNAVLGGAAGLADVYRYDGLNEFFMQSEIIGFEIFSPLAIETDILN